MGKYNVDYYKCCYCGFIQTEKPYWLDEAYVEPINRFDVGLVNRNLQYSNKVKVILSLLFNANSNSTFIDYGGGYGLFVRLMRDSGFNFYRYEPYCINIFAKGFDYSFDDSSKDEVDLITAFELFEHLEDPLGKIGKIFTYSSNIYFSTALIPKNNPKPDEWWYYGLEHGQHISFYTLKSLKIIAEKYGTNIYSNEADIHLFTKNKKLTSQLFKLMCKNKINTMLSLLIKKESLVNKDFTEAVIQFNLQPKPEKY